jgi:hypothetical protein
VLGVAYYLFHGGLWLRARRGRPVHLERLRPSLYTRQFAGIQMGLVATALYPFVSRPATTITAALFLTPSLVLFARDWLVVVGRLDATRGAEVMGRLGNFLLGTLPIPLRLTATGGLLILVSTGPASPALLALAALVALGILTRVSAFVASVALCGLLAQQPSPLSLITFTALVALLLTGAGPVALWSPEDHLFLRRVGERSARS